MPASVQHPASQDCLAIFKCVDMNFVIDPIFEATIKKLPCPECGRVGHISTQRLYVRVQYKGHVIVVVGEGWICIGGCETNFMSHVMKKEFTNKKKLIDGGQTDAELRSLTLIKGDKDKHDALFLRLFDNPSTLPSDEIVYHVKNTFKNKLDHEDMRRIAKIMLLQVPASALRNCALSTCDRNYDEADRLHDLLDRCSLLGIGVVKS